MASAAAPQAPSLSQLADGLLHHHATPYTFSFTPFLQKTYNHSLPADRPICKSYAATGHCPQGTRCPERHTQSGAATGGGPRPEGGAFNSLVCKHWLRGLCKKGESCEFLHEYNLRKMPECNFFVRNGYCSNGDECLYLHIDPLSKLPPCPHYEQGFCPLGPRCAKKHVRRALCPLYLAGFCPEGKACKEGVHPKWEDPKTMGEPSAKVERTAEEEERAKREAAEREEEMMEARRRDRDGDRDRGRDRDRDGDRGGGHDRHKDKFGGGGRGGRWRGGRGGGRFRGRNH